jgi:dethiobiotin synthetase
VRGVFVTGTDTEVGKTVVASCIAAALASRGERVAAFKPAVTGLGEAGELPDHELLRAAAGSGQEPAAVAPYRYLPAVSPHLAARLAGETIDRTLLERSARRAAESADVLVVEGVGGLLVPLGDDYLVRDFAAGLVLPIVIAARPSLGTINHSLLTIEAARAAGLRVAGLVLTPWPAYPGALERSNRETIARAGRVEVSTLETVDVESVPDAARAGASLPLTNWVGSPSSDTAKATGGRFPTYAAATIAGRGTTA